MTTPTVEGRTSHDGYLDLAQVSFFEERVGSAAQEWVARKTGVSTPAGSYTPRGYWYPDDGERQACCRTHRPSQTYPQAVRKHCIGLQHVARLFDVPPAAVRQAARHQD